MGLLDVRGYYRPLAALLDHAVHEGFLRAEHRAALHIAETPDELLERFAGWRPPRVDKWFDRTAAGAAAYPRP